MCNVENIGVMSEDLNLPASLERLEINPERPECCKVDHNRNILVSVKAEPECTLQSLSLKAECPKGNCHCNRKREKEVTVKRLPFKRPIVRRSKLNPLVLRSPVLRLREGSCVTSPQQVSSSDDSSIQPPSRVCGEKEEERGGGERVESSGGSGPALTSSCALQARCSPDDTTIDELASYFDLFVHIPKKMSFMAEMMYT